MTREEKAREYFAKGYNCAQSVVLAFEDLMPIDKDMLINLSAGFGGGFGRTRNMCGAVSAMALVLGILQDKNFCDDKDGIANSKKEIYKRLSELDTQFKEINGSDNCAVLLANVKNLTAGSVPDERTEKYYKVRPCIKFVEDSVRLIKKELNLSD